MKLLIFEGTANVDLFFKEKVLFTTFKKTFCLNIHVQLEYSWLKTENKF